MNNKKLLTLTPAVILGTAIPNGFSHTYPDLYNSNLENSDHIVFENNEKQEWLMKVINYYYSKLEEEISSLTSQANLNTDDIKFLKNKSAFLQLKKIYNSIKKQCENYADISKPGFLVFPIDRNNFTQYRIPITSFYGPRTIKKFGISFYHRGLDIAGVGGTPVLSPLPGYIVYAKRESSNNIYTLIVYHGKGIYSRWAHVNPVKSKGFVQAGDTIARIMHRSRQSTGPHAHFEIIKKIGDDYYNINPYSDDFNYQFNILENREKLPDFENYYENIRFTNGYKEFSRRAKKIFRRYYNKKFNKNKKFKAYLLKNNVKELKINEKSLDAVILKNIRKSLRKKIFLKLRDEFANVALSPAFLKYFSSNIINLVDVNLSDKGGFDFKIKDTSEYIKQALDKYYPEVVYESFKTYFSNLNHKIFSHVVENISLSKVENILDNKKNKFFLKLLKKNEILRSLLWNTYNNFITHFKENIQKIFFLNLDLPSNINSIEQLIQYNGKLIERKKQGKYGHLNLQKKLIKLDLKIQLLKKNKDELFRAIINHPNFEELLVVTRNDFNSYLKTCLQNYIKSLKLNTNPVGEEALIAEKVREKDNFVDSFLKSYPLGDTLKSYITVKNLEDRVKIFFKSPGYIMGHKICGVKIVKENSEKALLLIEHEKKKGKNYKVLARFKPSYTEEFNSSGFYFEIFKHEKIMYLKSFDEYCQVKQYINIDDIKAMHLDITIHPLNTDLQKTTIIKKLLKPFEFSVPVAL